jgi:hypothetical protein
MRHGRTPLASLSLVALVALVVAACSAAASPASSPAAPATAQPPAAPSSPSAASRPGPLGFDGRDAVVVAGRTGVPGLMAIQASTGEAMAVLPDGTPTGPAWGSLATTTASADAATTTVGDLIIQPDGGDGTSITIDGAWALPRIGYDPTPVGLSADGKTLVLVPAGTADPHRTASRFAVVPFPPIAGAPQLAPRVVELPGALDFDAVSPDGRILYVVQHLDGDGGYQVRAVDLPAGTMRPEIITDKRNLDEAMAGWPIAQLRSPTGLVLTLYRGVDHPFIHALDTAGAWAVCIDLPGGGSEEQDAGWGLAASESWASVYAVNAARNLAVDVDPKQLVARRTVTLTTASAPTIELAKFGHADGGPVGRRVIATTTGQTVFAAGPDGVLRLARDLTVEGRLLPGVRIESIGLVPDGRTLFALRADGAIVAVDTESGALVGELPAGGYDRLAAVMPG